MNAQNNVRMPSATYFARLSFGLSLVVLCASFIARADLAFGQKVVQKAKPAVAKKVAPKAAAKKNVEVTVKELQKQLQKLNNEWVAQIKKKGKPPTADEVREHSKKMGDLMKKMMKKNVKNAAGKNVIQIQAQAGGARPIQVKIQVGGNGKVIIGGAPPAKRTLPSTKVPPVRIDIPLERAIERNLERAKEQITNKQFALAITALQDILDTSEDYFMDEKKTLGLRRYVELMISKLPKEALRVYELEYNSAADKLIKKYQTEGDIAFLVEASRRFLNTNAGARATWLYGRHLADRSRFLAAIECFDRLEEIPRLAEPYQPTLTLWTAISWNRLQHTDKAKKILNQYLKKNPKIAMNPDEEQVTLFLKNGQLAPQISRLLDATRPADAMKIHDWSLPRGSQSGNAVVDAAFPLGDSKWFFRGLDESDCGGNSELQLIEKILSTAEKANSTQFATSVLLPAIQPIVVGETVVVSTVNSIKAFHVRSGKLLWETAHSSETFQYLLDNHLNQPTAPKPKVANNKRGFVRPQVSQINSFSQFLAQRAWDDFNTGSLSSDGKRVFTIAGRGIVGPSSTSRNVMFRQGQGLENHPLAPQSNNRLMAYDLQGGKLLWEIGGERDASNRVLAGTFFLGPPLPYEGKLYILGEFSKEVHLCVIDPKTGKLDWIQPLVGTELGIALDTQIRFKGYSPVLAGGVLLCPTGTGTIIAIDPATRSLVWESSFMGSLPSHIRYTPPSRFRGGRFYVQPKVNAIRRQNGWIGVSLIAVGGRALVTSYLTDELACIDLLDGKILWKMSRGNNLFLAGTYQENAILIGTHHVESISLSTGKKNWSQAIAQVQPAAKGVRDGDRYHLPVSSGKILTFSLKDGRKLAESPLENKDRKLGNLVAAQGVLVSADIRGAFAFASTSELLKEVEENFKSQPNDIEVLARRGHIQLLSGDTEGGLQTLLKAHSLKPHPMTSQLIASIILEGLRTDFDKYEQIASELLQFIEDDSDRFLLLVYYTDGLMKAGREKESLARLFQFVDKSTREGTSRLFRISGSVKIRPTQWVRSRFHKLAASNDAALQTLYDEGVTSRFDAAIQEKGSGKIQHLLAFFPGHTSSFHARKELISRLSPIQNGLEIERHILWLRQNGTQQDQAFATAQWVKLLNQNKRLEEASPLLAELKTQFGDIQCNEKQTGKELSQQWISKDSKIAKYLSTQDPWKGVDLAIIEKAQSSPRVSRSGIAGKQRTGLVVQDWNYTYDSKRNWQAWDGYGNSRWQYSSTTSTANGAPNYNRYNRYARPSNQSTVRQFGHLAIASTGSNFFALNTLSSTEKLDKNAKLLWQGNASRGQIQTAMNSEQMMMQQLMINGRSYSSYSNYGVSAAISEIQDGIFCYQRNRDLVALDPWTGETLWVREGALTGTCKIILDGSTIVVQALRANSNRSTRRSVVVVNGVVQQRGGVVTKVTPIAPPTYFSSIDGSSITLPNEKGQLETIKNIVTQCAGKPIVVQTQKTGLLISAKSSYIRLGDPSEWKLQFPSGSRFFHKDQSGNGLPANNSCLSKNYACVLETNGDLYGVNLLDGTKTKLTKLSKPSGLLQLYIVEDSHRRFIVESRKIAPVKNKKGGTTTTRVTTWNSRTEGIVNGTIYCFGKLKNELLWKKGVKNQTLVLTQPVNSPALVFGGSYNIVTPYKRTVRGRSYTSRRNVRHVTMYVLNKDNGTVLLDKDELNQNYNIQGFTVNPETQLCKISLWNKVFSIKPKSQVKAGEFIQPTIKKVGPEQPEQHHDHIHKDAVPRLVPILPQGKKIQRRKLPIQKKKIRIKPAIKIKVLPQNAPNG